MNALAKRTSDLITPSLVAESALSVKPLVLVVEDHEDTRTMLRCLMEMHGYKVAEAADGEEAVRLAGMLCPDIILMDTTLPIVDGLTATRRIRQLTAIRRVPIIFLSGHAQPGCRDVALATGGDDYLVKPIMLSELEIIVENHLGKSAHRKDQ